MNLESMRPPHYEQGLRDFCQAVKAHIKKEKFTLVEVGSFTGESAVIFAQEFPQAKIFCVDPFLGGYDDNDYCSRHDFESVESKFDLRTKDYPNITKVKKLSTQVTKKCDIVYLDGNHTFDAVKEDILHWKPQTKSIISGHDYTTHCGVHDAVNELLGTPDATFQDASWIKYVS